MSKHTPGPWMASQNEVISVASTAERVVITVNVVECETGAPIPEQAIIDARLIAAAPDLLAALKTCVFVVETLAHLRGMEAELLPHAEFARAAIAKATGGAL